MIFYIKTLTGKTIELNIDRSEPIWKVMLQIQYQIDVPADQQHLIYKGKNLDPDHSFSDYDIEEGATVHLVLQSRQFQVFVEMPDKILKIVDAKRSDYIDTVKNNIQLISSVPMEEQSLTFEGEELKDWKILSDYDIEFRSTLKLEINPDYKFEIFIQTQIGKIIKLDVKNTNTVGQIKQIIKDKIGISPEQQILSYAKQKLEDNYSLQSYGIMKESTIHLNQQINEKSDLDANVEDDPLKVEEYISSQSEDQLFDELHSIQNTHSEKEKMMKANHLCIHLKNIYSKRSGLQLTSEFCTLLNQLLDESSVQVQKELLEIVDIIAQIGEQFRQIDSGNEYYDQFEESDLNHTYEVIMRRNMKDENIENSQIIFKYPEFVIRLVETFSLINKFNTIGYYNRQILGNFFIISLNNLNKIFKQEKIYDSDKNQNQILDDVRIMKTFVRLLMNQQNRKYFQDKFNIFSLITPLIHINCPQELNCPQSIQLPMEPQILQLQGAVFEMFTDLDGRGTYIPKEVIEKKNVIFEHLAEYIMSCFDYLQDQQSQSLNHASSQQVGTQSSSPSIIPINYGSVAFFQQIQKHRCYIYINSTYIPGLTTAFACLSNLGMNQQFHSNGREEKAIRIIAQDCVCDSLQDTDEEEQEEIIIDLHFIRNLIKQIGMAGGSANEGEENQIRKVLNNIGQTLSYFGRDLTHYKQNPNVLLKYILEDIIEEGGLEEVNSYLFFLSKDIGYSNVHGNAQKVRKQIVNYWKDRTNQN
ncbi:MAG: putative Polyubiquitin [Streblomastix strix]|uniref:Putative Polyubiquitin n=1 Tax=Streblomastix strix TaxID=222440 RepID=A0A5J4V528_9EUKA|nr:MAG: putative Polyubiquitin [Streblomastix strix]